MNAALPNYLFTEGSMSNSTHIVYTKKFLKSKAYLSLSATAIKVLNFFHMRKQMVKSKGKNGGWICKNDGEIIFTYDEAETLGFTRRSFRDALDRLINAGFIRINHHGGGMKHDESTYFVHKCDMWEVYGTDEFKVKPRGKDIRGLGFKKGNKLSPRKTKSSDILVTVLQ